MGIVTTILAVVFVLEVIAAGIIVVLLRRRVVVPRERVMLDRATTLLHRLAHPVTLHVDADVTSLGELDRRDVHAILREYDEMTEREVRGR